MTRGPEVGAYYHPSFQKEDFKLASQMSCINAKSAQQLHPLDPVALGVVPLGDPAGILQWTHEQEHWRMYHHYHTQQQAFMAQVMVQQQQAGEAAVNSAVKLEGEPIVDGSNIKEESKDGTVGAHGTSTDALPMPHLDEQQMAAMQSFYEQQHQYYSAVVAQQQHPSPSSTTVEDTAVSGATPPELEPEVHTEISETHETLVLPPAPLDSEQQELSTAEVDAANDGSVEALV